MKVTNSNNVSPMKVKKYKYLCIEGNEKFIVEANDKKEAEIFASFYNGSVIKKLKK